MVWVAAGNFRGEKMSPCDGEHGRPLKLYFAVCPLKGDQLVRGNVLRYSSTTACN